MPKDNDWGHVLPVGTFISDNDFPEDIGIIIERNIKGYYKVYAITGHWPSKGKIDWYDRGYIEDRCNVVIEATPYSGGRKRYKRRKREAEEKQ